jgi:hypothetical protein
MSLELGMKSRKELIEEMVEQMGLDGLGEEHDDKDNDEEGDTTKDIGAAAPDDVVDIGNDAHEEA